MTMLSDNWIPSASDHLSLQRSESKCSEPDDMCIKISKYYGEDSYIRRSVPNTYSAYTLKFDIALPGSLEINDYCRIKYSFDGNTFIYLKSYQGRESTVQLLNQSYSFQSLPGDDVWIQFETDGDSSTGGDSCYYDNICLFGGQGMYDTSLLIRDDLISSLPLSSFSWPGSDFYDDRHYDDYDIYDYYDYYTLYYYYDDWGWESWFNNSYLQVDLGALFLIDSISTWGYVGWRRYDTWVKSYNLTFSIDGEIFTPYIHNPLQGNINVNDEKKNVLSQNIVTQYLRFIPIEFHDWKGFNLDASGYSYVPLCLL